VLGDCHEHVQIVIARRLASRFGHQRRPDPTAPKLRMSLDHVEPAHTISMEDSAIRDESLPRKSPVPVAEAGLTHSSVWVHLSLPKYAMVGFIKFRLSAYQRPKQPRQTTQTPPQQADLINIALP
jgi:hypothetical protein